MIPDVVTLTDAKKQLNITGTADDAELAGFISAASGVVEHFVGAVIHRPVTETFDGGDTTVTLGTIPVASITSVTDSGEVIDPAGYSVRGESGVLRRIAGVAPLAFLPGYGTVTVSYVAGRAASTGAVDGKVRLAALIILQHMWETQRPAGAGPFNPNADDYDPRYACSIPRRAQELLGVELGEAVGFV